ncbi:hypothetical protein E6C60_2111 [Paenibacillus algicola]|uniref:DUF5050 domain-containing protein n=2 Tax=Paenibacillus algicola TaxID=2565926 RepID=A0A4P8XJL4_9BACL|nr:hypothetical protein E6C60_2111 [Paenibacillus algicola]
MQRKKSKYIVIMLTVVIIAAGIVTINIANKNDKPTSNQQATPSEIAEKKPPQSITATASSPPAVQQYKLKSESFVSTFVAPSYISDSFIAFEKDISEKATSYIDTFSLTTKQLKNIYQTPNKEIINSLVGVEDKLFWVEYSRDQEKDKSWEIKSLDLKTNQKKTLFSGASEDNIEPPILRVFDDQVTWIEKTIKDHIVYSSAMLYKPITNDFVKVATSELNEQGKHRKGIYMAIQRPVPDGMLVQQSVFKTVGDTTDKSYEIVFYPYDQSKPITLRQSQQGMVDFTADQKWFVWSEIGKLSVADRKTGEIRYVIEAKDKDLTIDSPFIRDNHLYYRYSMYQIFDVDLTTGKTSELSEYRLSTSKIFNTSDYLGYSYMDAKNNNGEVEFEIISPINQTN